MREVAKTSQSNLGKTSVSRSLFDMMFENSRAFPGADQRDRRGLLISAIQSDLDNWVCVPDVAADLINQCEAALSEIDGLSSDACYLLHSVVELAQADETAFRDCSERADRWYTYLQAQDAMTFVAPVIIDHVRRFGHHPYDRVGPI